MGNTEIVIPKGEELCLLVDNGSVRDHAVLFTRKLAKSLQAASGIEVRAVSLDHSDRIALDKLNGVPVPILEAFLREQLFVQYPRLRRLTLLPLLMVGGGAIHQKMVRQFESFKLLHPNIECQVAGALIDPNDSENVSIPWIMSRSIAKTVEDMALVSPVVIVVDHGSPNAIAAKMRDWVAAEVGKTLPSGRVQRVVAASMERRDGCEYSFNEPLLEDALKESAQRGIRQILVAKLFLQPGKHSGRRGDIESIIDRVRAQYPEVRIFVPKQIFTEKDLIQLLQIRLMEV